MFVTGPGVVKTVTQEVVTQEELGGADTHAEISGVAHRAFDTEMEALRAVRELIDYLPLSNAQAVPTKHCTDPIDRQDESMRYI
jgi:propionyl-CoA carboxylase beta chain